MHVIPVIYAPVLMITHVVAFYLLPGPQPKAVRALAGDAASGQNKIEGNDAPAGSL